MKRMEIFCASEASTAICLSTDQGSCSSSSSNTILLGSRVIDRHNPIINDSRRSTSKSLTAPCSSSHSPINPKPYHELHKPKKSSSSNKKKNPTQHLNINSPTVNSTTSQVVYQDENVPVSKLSSSSHPKSSSSDQVVVLRVSLHCKGCEGKVRKHLSRMQGVTSFNIDFAAKKVTVVGDVTPLSVLASISKVKNAQLWPATVETK